MLLLSSKLVGEEACRKTYGRIINSRRTIVFTLISVNAESAFTLISVNAEGIVLLEFIFIIPDSVRFSAPFSSYKFCAIETIQVSKCAAF